jgi:hypothetical protein
MTGGLPVVTHPPKTARVKKRTTMIEITLFIEVPLSDKPIVEQQAWC